MAGKQKATAMQKLRDESIVRTAAELFIARGIEAVKMTDIADGCGVGVASLYRYYGTKANIAVAASTFLWKRFGERFDLLVAQSQREATGLARMRVLLGCYSDVYKNSPSYIAFLDEFDHVLLSENVDRTLLEEYEAELSSFFDSFAQAFHAGVTDGSIRADVDFPLFFRSVSHALMGVAQKLIRGEVIPSDDFSNGEAELACLVDMVIGYLAVEEQAGSATRQPRGSANVRANGA